jgi:hypothetical protein
MKKSLDIAPTLNLPLDAATETFGILAKKGSGKSNAAVVMAEQMYDAGIPWAAIDPKGDWWGMRSSGDGKEAGLPLPVFGGRHADVPLEAGAGVMMADLILSENLTCVLDVSEFTKAEVSKFLIAFADRLYRQAEDEPFHLFLEEAHEYLPQRVMRDEARLVGAWQKIVKQGRFKGLGCTLISQRSASLNKDVLTQVDTLFVLRTTSPQDRMAVKGWVDIHDASADMLDTLPSLENGEAWVWSPEFLKTFERIKFHHRRTFDSGATPKVGQTRRPPATLADVDLDAIKVQMAETIEKAKATDPALLRRRITELEKQLASQKPEIREVIQEVKVIEYVEIPFPTPWLPPETVEKIKKLAQAVEIVTQDAQEVLIEIESYEAEGATELPPPRERQAPVSVTRPPTAAPKLEPVSRPSKPASQLVVAQTDSDATPITGGALRMLKALGAHREFVVTRSQLGTLARLKSKSGTYAKYLSTLRTQGLIEVEGKTVRITDAGMDYLGNEILIPKTTEELHDQWRQVISGGALRMFDILIEVYPEVLSRQELAERAELESSSGTFAKYLSTLRTNNLAEVNGQGVRASDALFLVL